MAVVDFSNAIIEPTSYTIPGVSYASVNPTYRSHVALGVSAFFDVNFTTVTQSLSVTTVSDQSKQLVVQFQGTFSGSGTEFYMLNYSGGGYVLTCWKVSNISFNSGDTFLFKVKANLVCQ